MTPRVHLANPAVEPTDEELQRLSMAALADAVSRHRKAEDRFQRQMHATLLEARDRMKAGQLAPSL